MIPRLVWLNIVHSKLQDSGDYLVVQSIIFSNRITVATKVGSSNCPHFPVYHLLCVVNFMGSISIYPFVTTYFQTIPVPFQIMQTIADMTTPYHITFNSDSTKLSEFLEFFMIQEFCDSWIFCIRNQQRFNEVATRLHSYNLPCQIK